MNRNVEIHLFIYTLISAFIYFSFYLCIPVFIYTCIYLFIYLCIYLYTPHTVSLIDLKSDTQVQLHVLYKKASWTIKLRLLRFFAN